MAKARTKKARKPGRAAAGKKHKMKSVFANITVTNGVGEPDPITVAPGELIHFTNEDNEDYLVELFINEMHPVVAVLLPALGDCRLMAEPKAKTGDRCTYNLVPTVLKMKPTGAGGGTHTIIITSGTSATAKAATAGA